jgi:hypothetical protein
MLNLIHFVRALLDCEAVSLAQYLNQFDRASFKDLLEPAHFGVCYLHAHCFALTGRPSGPTTLHHRVADRASLTGGLGA